MPAVPWRTPSEHAAPAETTSAEADRATDSLLFVASNPSATRKLALGKEFKAIRREWRQAKHRDDVKVILEWAATVDDLVSQLSELQPKILHAGCHGGSVAGSQTAGTPDARDALSPADDGDSGTIVLEDDQGKPQSVSGHALALMIASTAPSVKTVVLNCCYSDALAEALLSVVDCVIGFSGAIPEEASQSFAVALHRALGSGRSHGQAADQARATLAAKHPPAEELVECRTRGGIDPYELFLTAAPSTRPRRPRTQEPAPSPPPIERCRALRNCLVGVAVTVALIAAAAALLFPELRGRVHETQDRVEPARQPADAPRARVELPRRPTEEAQRGRDDETRPPAQDQRPAQEDKPKPAYSPARNQKAAQRRVQAQKLALPTQPAQYHAPRPTPSEPGEATSLGELDRETIQRYVRYFYRDRIRTCYEQRLAVKALAGKVRARFVIAADGRVADSTASGLDREVASCVAGVIKDIAFPASSGEARVNYSFNFFPTADSI